MMSSPIASSPSEEGGYYQITGKSSSQKERTYYKNKEGKKWV